MGTWGDGLYDNDAALVARAGAGDPETLDDETVRKVLARCVTPLAE